MSRPVLPWTRGLLAFVLLACADSTAPHVCGIGDTRSCMGPGRCRGAQLCLEDQGGFGECDCGDDAGEAGTGSRRDGGRDPSKTPDAAVNDGVMGMAGRTSSPDDAAVRDASELPQDAAAPAPDAGGQPDAGPEHDAAMDAGMDAAADAGPDAGPDAGQPPFEICGMPVDLQDYVARGSEFIFDVATTAANTETNPLGAQLLAGFLGQVTLDRFPWLVRPEGCEGEAPGACYDGAAYRELVFEGSDTVASALLGISYSLGADGTGGFAVLNNEDLRALQTSLNQPVAGDPVLLAPAVMPNDRIELQLDAMERWAPYASAWLTWTGWAPSAGGGYYLDDAVGTRMIEQGIALGVPTFIVAKGRPLSGFSPVYTSPRDVGPAADAYPEARFLILHSAFEQGLASGGTTDPPSPWPEGPYDENDPEVQEQYPLDRGVNSLIHSLRTAGVGPNENVYAVLNVVWAHLMIRRPTEAAHVLGKLLLHVGEDNVLWGTDSVFYGGPAPQIEAFRNFQIPADMRARYGYPELTRERKAKVLGLNAARVFCVQPP